jgi:hypothetical protein
MALVLALAEKKEACYKARGVLQVGREGRREGGREGGFAGRKGGREAGRRDGLYR